MACHLLIYAFIFPLIYCPSLITAQQSYVSNNCFANNTSSTLGYRCNAVNQTCQSYLVYRTQPPYNTLFSISSLLSANDSQVSAINNIPENKTLETDYEVIVPVTCSCAGNYSQVNTTWLVRAGDSYYVLANDTFEGLTTCNAIRQQKISPNIVNIFPNERLTIPIRCACPTSQQVNKGIKYLMSFVVRQGHATIAPTAIKFGADVGQTLEANEKTEQDSKIQPFTTLLVPLQTPPNGSQIMFPPPISNFPSAPPRPPSSQIAPSSLPIQSSSSKKWAFFGVGLAAGAVFVLIVELFRLFILPRTRRNKADPTEPSQTFEEQEKGLGNQVETDPVEALKSISNIASLKLYSLNDLETATDNFSSDNWIQGSVYKGILDGNQVAIKKMNGDVTKEINVLNKINHSNLISLLGVCFNHGVWHIVYEYAANGPLSDWIYQDNPLKRSLSWGKRMQVAYDVATGLNYCHSYTSPPYVHKDINSSNILLDGDFRAKIAKVGLSRQVRGGDDQFTLTKHIIGTKGYMAPEFLENGVVSPMLDVYSFGVLLLEMLTGKDVASLYEGVKVHLSELVTPLLSDAGGNLLELKAFIDQSLGDNYPYDIAVSMVILVDRCLKKDPGNRPTMDEIMQLLSKTLTNSSVILGSTSVSTSSSVMSGS